MRHLLGSCAVAVAVLCSCWVADTQAQNPNQRTLPPAVTSYFANPVMNFYQRQRELREQTNLQRDINQLQKIALEKARKTAQPATDPQTGAPIDTKTPHSSVIYKEKDKKAAAAKTDPMKPASKDKSEPSTEEKGPRYAKTFSNYAKMLRR